MNSFLSVPIEDIVILSVFVLLIAIPILLTKVLYKQYFAFKRAHPLLIYCVKRFFYSFLTLILALCVVFLFLRFLPKDNYLNNDLLKHMSSEQFEKYAQKVYAKYGLDKPIWEQLYLQIKNFIPYMKKVCIRERVVTSPGIDSFTGVMQVPGDVICIKYMNTLINFGITIKYNTGTDIWQMITERAPTSMSYLLPTSLIAIAVGYVIGILMARYKGKTFDNVSLTYSYIISAAPFIVILFVMIAFFTKNHINYIYNKRDYLTLIPPMITILMLSIPEEAVFARRYAVDEMNADYTKFARAKGLSESRIFFIHIMRNIAVILFAGIPSVILGSLTGSFFTEDVFRIDGLGKMSIVAIQKFDTPLVMSMTFFLGVITIASLFLSDVCMVIIDPRVSLMGNK